MFAPSKSRSANQSAIPDTASAVTYIKTCAKLNKYSHTGENRHPEVIEFAGFLLPQE
jgi:hypothetical protein